MVQLVVILVLVFFIGGWFWTRYTANYALTVESGHQPDQARSAARSCFVEKANRFDSNGPVLTVTPKLKKDAPTLAIEIRAAPSGSQISMSGSYTSERVGRGPWFPKHGMWIWRKQRKIASRLSDLS